MALLPLYEDNEPLFRKQLSALLESMGLASTGALSSLKLTPMTTLEKEALTDVAGMVVYDSDLDKLCVNNGAAWETITSA